MDDDRVAEIVAKMTKDRDGEQYSEWTWLVSQDPDFMEVFSRFTSFLKAPGEDRLLPTKYAELITIAILAYRGFHYTLASHMRRAMAHGASKAEIMEALEHAIIPGGAPVMHLGIQALRSLEADEQEVDSASSSDNHSV